jgi:hypothetical protein
VIWPWKHHDPGPDPKAEAAEERAAELEQRAEMAEVSLRTWLRSHHDPWAEPVLSTIHERGRRHGR